ncbi:hypothetical protein BGZ61DRAFT_534875 [Ilyonectria robusta]|uniref:uncharacterized protein n=1 Tax=Ilyonectria robusta TaxID=1079257 RepID=UPI001E8D6933|nr:uncharacterized protein BGZ61DRAFT_534875 [Ilyonectria robusta]KAH8683416.1 hypothetical protein BGZ61DRAFT_534875 [Ilyonectria robusta]
MFALPSKNIICGQEKATPRIRCISPHLCVLAASNAAPAPTAATATAAADAADAAPAATTAATTAAPLPLPVPVPVPAPTPTPTPVAATRGQARRPPCRYCGRRGHRSEICWHQPNTITVLSGGSALWPPGTKVLLAPGTDPVVLVQGRPKKDKKKKNKKKGTGGGGCQERRDLGRGPEPGGGGSSGAPPTGTSMQGVRA